MIRSPDEVSRSCVLIGDGNLVIECGEVLQAAGFRIPGVGSADPAVRRWAAQFGAEARPVAADTAEWVRGIAPDYIFSIFNLAILPEAVLDAARIAAVNYHDGPLPRYAGLHATSWAILNGERTHGVTWHVMAPGIDTGPVLIQQSIDVTAVDTSLSLNLKCSAACVKALKDLIPDLIDGTLRPCHRTSALGRITPVRDARSAVV